MRRYQEENVYVIEMDEITDVDTHKLPRMLERNADLSKSFNAENSDSWRGGSREKAYAMLTDGWAEGLEKVSALVEEFKPTLSPPKSFKRKQQWREEGDEPSWEREQAGKTDIWRTSRREMRVGPTTVQLICPWVHSASRRADDIVWNGVVLAALCDLLETAGYRVGAMMANTIGLDGYNQFMLGMLHVKQPQQPLDLASLVPIVAHPTVYRWFAIDWATLCERFCGYGHGRVVSINEIPDIPSKPRGAVVLRSVYSAGDAKREIERVLGLFAKGNPASSHSELEAF